MDTSLLLARLLSIMLIVIYGGYLLNHKFYSQFWQNLADSPVLIFLSGFIALLCGLLIVQFHNIWTFDWKVIMTLLGWILIFSGVARIAFPKIVLKLAQKVMNYPSFVNCTVGIMFLIGLYLAYKGFFSSIP